MSTPGLTPAFPLKLQFPQSLAVYDDHAKAQRGTRDDADDGELERIAPALHVERIADRGGVLGAMETGYQRGRIQDESMLYEHRKHDGSLPIIGVNTFVKESAADAQPREAEDASCATPDTEGVGIELFAERALLRGGDAVNDLYCCQGERSVAPIESIMGRATNLPMPSAARALTELGANIRLARLRRRLAASLLAARLVDELVLMVAPKVFGAHGVASVGPLHAAIDGFVLDRIERLGDDFALPYRSPL